VLEQPDHTVRRARTHERDALREAPDVVRMEAIDVFRRMDALDDLRAADLPGQRQLHQDAIHPLVGVELIDQSEELGLRSQRRQVVGERHDADLFTGATLAAHVHRGGWVIADLDDCESGAPCAAG